MKEFLSDHGIAYTAYNVAEDPAALEALEARTGQRATPAVVVAGVVVIGFDRGRLQRLLRLTDKGSA